MNTFKKTAIILLLVTIFAIPAFGDDSNTKRGRRGHHAPPAEAYTACEGKCEGDRAELVTPRGDTIKGTCQKRGDRLFLRPDNPPPGHHEKNEKMEDIES